MIIALCGPIGVGKTYLVKEHLVPRGFIDIAFADQVKIQLVAEGKLTYEEAYVTKPDNMRRLMFQRGTVEGWQGIRENIWGVAVLSWIRRLQESLPNANFVISDARFLHELHFLRSLKIPLVLITAPNRNRDATKGMYAEVVTQEEPLARFNEPFDAVLNNDYGVTDLAAQVEQLLLTLHGGANG